MNSSSMSQVRKRIKERQARDHASTNPFVHGVKLAEDAVAELEIEVSEAKLKLELALVEFTSVSRAAYMLSGSISARGFVGKIRRGEIVGMKVGKHWYVLKSQLTELIEVEEFIRGE